MNWFGYIYNFILCQGVKSDVLLNLITPIYDIVGTHAANALNMLAIEGEEKTSYFSVGWDDPLGVGVSKRAEHSIENGEYSPYVWFRLPPGGTPMFLFGTAISDDVDAVGVIIRFEYIYDVALGLDFADSLSYFEDKIFTFETGLIGMGIGFEEKKVEKLAPTVMGLNLVRIASVTVTPGTLLVPRIGDFTMNLRVLLPPSIQVIYADP